MRGAQGRCICGCRSPATHRHHVVYRQELARIAKTEHRGDPRAIVKREMELVLDPRNLVAVAHKCHGQHHNRVVVLPLRRLPDSVFEFAGEVLGPGAAIVYLERRYDGADTRIMDLERDERGAS